MRNRLVCIAVHCVARGTSSILENRSAHTYESPPSPSRSVFEAKARGVARIVASADFHPQRIGNCPFSESALRDRKGHLLRQGPTDRPSAWKSDAFARFFNGFSDKSQPNTPVDFKRQFCAVGTPLRLLLWRSLGLHTIQACERSADSRGTPPRPQGANAKNCGCTAPAIEGEARTPTPVLEYARNSFSWSARTDPFDFPGHFRHPDATLCLPASRYARFPGIGTGFWDSEPPCSSSSAAGRQYSADHSSPDVPAANYGALSGKSALVSLDAVTLFCSRCTSRRAHH
jgi:hypothetical protein